MVRAAWLPVQDENGRIVARYAYWVEDLQGKIDPKYMGNTDGPGGDELAHGGLGGLVLAREGAVQVLPRKTRHLGPARFARLLQFRAAADDAVEAGAEIHPGAKKGQVAAAVARRPVAKTHGQRLPLGPQQLAQDAALQAGHHLVAAVGHHAAELKAAHVGGHEEASTAGSEVLAHQRQASLDHLLAARWAPPRT